MFRQTIPPTHEDKKAQKLMDKIAKMSAASEKKQFYEDSSQATSQTGYKKPFKFASPPG